MSQFLEILRYFCFAGIEVNEDGNGKVRMSIKRQKTNKQPSEVRPWTRSRTHYKPDLGVVLFDDPEEDPYEPPIVGPESKKVRKGSDEKKSKTKVSKESYETTFQSFIKSKGAKPAKDSDAN